MISDGVHDREVSRWKMFADGIDARFFIVPHQTSDAAWRGLEEWVSRAMVSPTVPAGRADELEAQLHRALADLKDRDAATRRANEEIASLSAKLEAVAASTIESEALAAKVKGLERMVAEGNRERDGLREQLAAEEKKANSLKKTYSSAVAKWEKEREEMCSAKDIADAAPLQVITTGIAPDIIIAFSKMIDLGEMTVAHAWDRIVARAGKTAS